jgi:septal ring factor EnvC (AmiA/AmiB activator)
MGDLGDMIKCAHGFSMGAGCQTCAWDALAQRPPDATKRELADLRDALAKERAEHEETKRERDNLDLSMASADTALKEARTDRDALSERVRVLEDALNPIATIDLKVMGDKHLDQITAKVRAALSHTPKEKP